MTKKFDRCLTAISVDYRQFSVNVWPSPLVIRVVQLAVDLVLLGACLAVAEQAIRRVGAGIACAAFVFLPLVLTPYWIVSNPNWIFPWVKLYTCFFNMAWLTGLRFTRFGSCQWAREAYYWILVVNILEAVFTDALGGTWANVMNVAAGTLVIATIPRTTNSIRIERGVHRDMLCDLTRPWIIGYTLWNAAFVYLNLPAITGHQLAVLTPSLIVGLLNPPRWLQARTCTLAADLVILATHLDYLVRRVDTTTWLTPERGLLAAAFSLAFMIGYAAWHFRIAATHALIRLGNMLQLPAAGSKLPCKTFSNIPTLPSPKVACARVLK